jgi:hypothetical protein
MEVGGRPRGGEGIHGSKEARMDCEGHTKGEGIQM